MISKRIQEVEPSSTVELTTRITVMKREGIPVIGLNVGEPDFDTPAHICQAARRAMEEGFTKYTPVMGTLELREAIADKLAAENHVQYGTDEITVGPGAKQCIYAALLALCDPGDEVIIPCPCWVSYTEMVRMAGGVPVTVREAGDFSLDLENIEQAVTDKTKAVIINTPNNPTGAVYSREILEGLAALAEKYAFYIISDEVYECMVYGGREHVSVSSLSEDARRRTVLINSFSKTYAMTGWRLGYLAAEREVVKAINVVQSQMISSVNSISQKAGTAALRGSQDCVRDMAAEYERRCAFLHERLNSIEGICCRKSEGAFYLLPDVTDYMGREYNGKKIEDDLALAEYLLEKARVAVVPGSAFLAPGHLRITCAASMETLKRAADAMEEALRLL